MHPPCNIWPTEVINLKKKEMTKWMEENLYILKTQFTCPTSSKEKLRRLAFHGWKAHGFKHGGSQPCGRSGHVHACILESSKLVGSSTLASCNNGSSVAYKTSVMIRRHTLVSMRTITHHHIHATLPNTKSHASTYPYDVQEVPSFQQWIPQLVYSGHRIPWATQPPLLRHCLQSHQSW